MNKALATTLVVLAGTFSAAAHAQSSVTLYGHARYGYRLRQQRQR
jgi:hypothetical protein